MLLLRAFERRPSSILQTSRELKIEGAIGCCSSMNVKNQCVSESSEIGLGGTCQWKFCSVTPNATLCVLFDVAHQVRPIVCFVSLETLRFFVLAYSQVDKLRHKNVILARRTSSTGRTRLRTIHYTISASQWSKANQSNDDRQEVSLLLCYYT